MQTLATVTTIAGMIMAAICLPAAFAPQRAIDAAKKFPRHVMAGRILAALALIWTAWQLLNANINWVNEHRPLVYLAVPAGWFLITRFMDELLAARALGGLLILAPMPILDAAFMNDSPWRLVMVALAYIYAITGMALVWSPYLFRKFAERNLNMLARARIWGIIGLAISLAFIVLARTVY